MMATKKIRRISQEESINGWTMLDLVEPSSELVGSPFELSRSVATLQHKKDKTRTVKRINSIFFDGEIKHFLPDGGFVYNISTPSHRSWWHAFRDCKEFSMLKRHP
jgi:hypothetical protein